jgi:hypothetical protein
VGGVPSGGPPGAAARGTLRGKDAHITTSWYPTNAGTLRLCWTWNPLPAFTNVPTPTGGQSRSARLFGPPQERAPCGRPLATPPRRPRALLGTLRTAGDVDLPLHGRRELSSQLGQKVPARVVDRTDPSAGLFGPPHVRAPLGSAPAPPASAPGRAPHRRGCRRPPLHGHNSEYRHPILYR